MSIFKIPRTTQPQGPVGIDWGNPITSNLTFCMAFSEGFRLRNAALQSNKSLYQNTSGYSVEKNIEGLTARLYSNYPIILDDNGSKLYDLSGDVTFFTRIKADSVTRGTYGQYLLSTGTAGGTGDQGGLGINNTGNVRFVTGSLSTGMLDTLDTLLPNTFYSLCATRKRVNGTTHRITIYINGRVSRTLDILGTVAPQSTLALGSYGAYNTGVMGFLGDIGSAMVWKRALSDAEVSAISTRPWQIFKPIDVNPQFITNARSRIVVPANFLTQRKSMMMGSSVAEDGPGSILIPPKRVRTTQPQGTCDIDGSNPICSGIQLVVSPNVNTVSRAAAVPSSASPVGIYSKTVGPWGGTIIPGSNPKLGLLSSSSNRTFCVLVEVGDSSSSYDLFYYRAGTYTFGTWFIRSYVGLFEFRYTNSSNSQAGVVGPSIKTRSRNVVVVTTTIDSVSIHLNGLLHGTTAITLGSSTIAGMTLAINGGDKMYTQLGVAWDRILSDQEISSISDNPWQIFKPDQRIIGVSS